VSFFNLYRHRFVRVAVAVPEVRVADPAFNAAETVKLLREASAKHVALTLFPELGLSSYTAEDLFHQEALLDASLRALDGVVAASRELASLALVGLPLRVDGLLYNCAAVVHRGRVLGVVPKTYLPNYREFYERRQFTPGDAALRESVELFGQRDVPFGSRLLFRARDVPDFALHVEICEDLWTPIPPSSYAALAGATVLANLSASNVTVGKDEYRRELASNQSARCLAAYLYSAAGYGESTTDLAWDGQAFVYENGTRLAETRRFAYASQWVAAEIDLERLVQDRMRQTTFGDASRAQRAELARFRTVELELAPPTQIALPLERRYARFPYVPDDPATRDARCREIYEIQVQGLVRRMQAMRAERVVIGVSGGLDSTQALLVCARAMDVLGLPRANVLAYTMPGFATSERTLDQARRLMEAVGARAHEIDIRPSALQMLRDIGHPYVGGESVFDATFENVQAGERTSHLFRLANPHAAPVVGTGDLSELALGWCTYGVGDQMAHYNVNASVPKTLIQHLLRYVARTVSATPEGVATARALEDVLDTEISPELVPASADGAAQSSQAVVGPYELQDFHLYYVLRFGYSPEKVAFLAWTAWREKYDIGAIKKWLGVFLQRFFAQSQFKRSAMPNGPKVGSGGSLSPRGDWRAPSDGSAAPWLAAWERIPDR
jgi:NAD+ synthase (glutamine-hydrolysing)